MNIQLIKGNSTESINTDEQEQKAEGKTRFRVATIFMSAEVRTIYAEDGNAAVKLVSEKNLGRHAGRQGPRAVSIAAQSFEDSPQPPDFIQMSMDQFMQTGAQIAMQQAQSAAKSGLIVPGMQLPEGFDPKGPKVAG